MRSITLTDLTHVIKCRRSGDTWEGCGSGETICIISMLDFYVESGDFLLEPHEVPVDLLTHRGIRGRSTAAITAAAAAITRAIASSIRHGINIYIKKINSDDIYKMTTQADTKVTQGKDGNTKSSLPLKSRRRKWCFTCFQYDDTTCTDLCDYFEGAKYLFQEEICPETKTPHLQGAVCFKNARYFSTLKEKFPTVHWEVMRNESASFDYCMKEESKKKDGLRRSGGLPKRLTSPIDKLYDWQKTLVEKLAKEPDQRSIMWYWEPEGNVGKTVLAKHICIKNPDAIYVSGKAQDVKYAVAQRVAAGKPPRIVIYGVPRTYEEYVSYAALEEVKDGIFFSGKYEAGMVMYNNPHVVVLANCEPEKEKVSSDRWDIVRIVRDELVLI